MNRKWLMMVITLLFAVAFITACGDKDNNNDNNANANTNENVENESNNDEENDGNNNEEENNNENDNDTELNDNGNNALNDEDEDEGEDEDGDETAGASGSGDFDELIKYMEDETEGTAEIIYEGEGGDEHDMDGVTVSVDSYVLLELNDFHENFSIPFDDDTNGGVLLAQYTVKNDTGDDLAYMPQMYLSYVGVTKAFNNYKDLLPEDEQLPSILAPSNDYELKAGDEVTGYYTYPFGEEQLNDVLSEGEVEVEVPQPQKDPDDFGTAIGEEGSFVLSLDAESTAENGEKESKGFYEDKVTEENMGDKTMIEEEDGIGKTETLGDVDVTLEGYQFTEFEPNSDEASRFESFENGIVLLTVKFDIDNGGDTEISKNSATSKLTMNDGSVYTLGEGMLLNYRNDDVIEAGDNGELLQVYPLDQRDYEDWKDRSFELEIGPMRDEEGKDISKGKKVQFDLK